MNYRMDPESEIGNISKDIQQNGDFRGACGESVFSCWETPRDPPGPPGASTNPASAQAELAGLVQCFAKPYAFASTMFRYATSLSLRIRIR